MAYTYKDMSKDVSTIRRTNGEFVKWTRGGFMGGPGALFKTKWFALFVPEYLLTAETLAAIPPKPEQIHSFV
jgi:hypothetical protein